MSFIRILFDMFSFLLAMKYMVATGKCKTTRGEKGGNKTEIIDVSNPRKLCVLDDNLDQKYSSGGMLGTTPVICGGFNGNVVLNECLLYGTSQKIMMNFKRYHHSSVGLNNSMLWIMGGTTDGSHVIDSTEFVTTEGAVNGPQLPDSIKAHCSVRFPDNGNVYVIGGLGYGPCDSDGCFYRRKVWVANPSNGFTFAQGPKLRTARSHHACGTMSIGTKSIIVVAGGISHNNRPLNPGTVEILDPQTNQWVAGTTYFYMYYIT